MTRSVPRKSVAASPIVWGAIAALTYIAMIFGPLHTLATLANLAPFDMRPAGYTHAQAIALLEALGTNGRQIYLTQQLRLDLVYPLALAATVTLLAARMRPTFKKEPGRFWMRVCTVTQAGAILTAILDYTENAFIFVMLRQTELVQPALVRWASTATIFKSVSTSVTLTLLLLCVLAGFFFRIKARTRNLDRRKDA